MKIAILTSGILPVPAVQGGAVETLIDFYLEYNEQHHLHDITVYSIPPKTSLWTRMKRKWFARTHRQGYYHPTIEYFLHEALKDIRRRHYDIIVLENRPGYALTLKEATTAKLVYHLHNDLLNSETPHGQELYDAAWRIITVSDYIRSRVMTIHPHDSKTITVHNGIDLPGFTTERKEHTQDCRPFTLLFLGRIIPEKGIEQLIDAMLLLQAHEDIRLVVVGGSFYANSTPTPFEQRLREKAEPIKERILFTNYIAHEKLYEHLQQADVAVLPSLWEEPFGLTCVEAMASGLPLITTRSGGIPEICDGIATIVDRNHLAENLATAILDLYQHPEKRQEMSLAGLERAKQFDKDVFSMRFFQAIESIPET